jgi:hypothetical protein
MLQALSSGSQRRRVARGATMPAPTEGWDTTSPLAEMSPKRAIQLDNWFPQAEYIELRKGFTRHRPTGVTDPVETLVVYSGASGSKQFAIAGGDIYETTASGAVGPTPDATITGLANSRIQYVNFVGTGGQYAWCCNGADLPFTYDGTVFALTPAITGITAQDVINVNIHKNRIWMVLKESTTVAYLDVDAIGGAATEFELGGLMSKGGYVMAMGTWSRDAGSGPDDYAVFATSRGQIIIYAGTDPDNAATWELIGVFDLGAPLGRRCFRKVGSDLAIISIDGCYPLSTALSLDRGAVERVAITKNIQRAMNDATRSYGSSFGWEVTSYPKGNMAIINVPLVENVTQHQYVMNTLTGAWCRFTGQNANCWEVMDDRLFFGGNDGVVYEADVAGADYTAAFTAIMKTSFQYYGNRGAKKRWTMVQPLVTTNYAVAVNFLIDVDFKDTTTYSYLSTQGVTNGSLWGQMIWGRDNWSRGQFTLTDWLSTAALGQSAALKIRVDVPQDAESTRPSLVQVNGFNLTLETGEFI